MVSFSPFQPAMIPRLSPFIAAGQPSLPQMPGSQKSYLSFQDLQTLPTADVLVVLAHPDDELAFSGTLTQLAKSGKSVQLVYVTNGSAGQDISGRKLANDALGETRSNEASKAIKALKIARPPLFLDFMDGKTDAFPDALKAQLRAVLLQTRPGMILMYNPRDGWTGHQDHINVARFLQEELDTLAAGRTLRDRQDRVKIANLLHNHAVYQFIFPQSAETIFRQFFPVSDPSWKAVRFQPDSQVAIRVALPPGVVADKAFSMGQHASQYRPLDVQKMAGFFSRYPYEQFARYTIGSTLLTPPVTPSTSPTQQPSLRLQA